MELSATMWTGQSFTLTRMEADLNQHQGLPLFSSIQAHSKNTQEAVSTVQPGPPLGT